MGRAKASIRTSGLANSVPSRRLLAQASSNAGGMARTCFGDVTPCHTDTTSSRWLAPKLRSCAMPAVEREGRSIHYSSDGDGPGIVLIPGLGSGARLFGTLPRRFARHGFTCAAIDPVGIAPSSALPGGIFDFSQAAHNVLAVAATLPAPVTLVGTSLGGNV